LSFDLLLPRLIAVAMILLVSFPVHECAHAFAAYRLGDGTAKLYGRLTLNPVAHFDPVGGLLLAATALVGFGFGWAKPTPVNVRMLRGGAVGEAIVAAAGPLSNLLLAAVGALVYRVLSGAIDMPEIVALALFYFLQINVGLFILNLIPIPPLDGSKVLYAALDPATTRMIRPTLDQYGFVLLLVAILPILGGGNSVVGLVFQSIGPPILNTLLGGQYFG
jgi:Zn-dependent protease